MLVSVACNDPDNGLFADRASAITFHNIATDEYLEFVHDDFMDGVPFKVDHSAHTCTLEGEQLQFISHKYGYGNWCWDAFRLRREDGLRLLLKINSIKDWQCEGGAVRLLDWLERQSGQQAMALSPTSTRTTP